MPNSIWRPFIDESPFNTKIPKDAKIHPNSEAMMRRMNEQHKGTTGGQNEMQLQMQSRKWSSAHFFVDSTQEDFIAIKSHYDWGHRVIAPFPKNAMETLTNADKAICIIDINLGRQWEFWELEGEYPNITCGNGSSSSTLGDGATRHCSRESGLTMHGGSIKKACLESDAIEHALVFSADARDGFDNFIYPATIGADFDSSDTPDDLPLGTRLRLRSDFDIESVVNPYAKKIIQCIRDYGMYLVDENEGWSIGLQWNSLEDIDKYFTDEFERELLRVTPDFLEVVNFEI